MKNILVVILIFSLNALSTEPTQTKFERPWGWYQTIAGDKLHGYQVKILHVHPGKRLSLQSHSHRAEHWVVVKGQARVRVGDTYFDKKANDYTFVAVGDKHRIENPGEEPLEIIETQTGDYLGEDDIVRYEDDFGRDK